MTDLPRLFDIALDALIARLSTIAAVDDEDDHSNSSSNAGGGGSAQRASRERLLLSAELTPDLGVHILVNAEQLGKLNLAFLCLFKHVALNELPLGMISSSSISARIKVTDDWLRFCMAETNWSRSVRVLNLSNGFLLTDPSIQALRLSDWNQLEVLVLSRCKRITNEAFLRHQDGVSPGCVLWDLPALTELRLDGTMVTNMTFLGWNVPPLLRILDVEGTRVTSTGIDTIVQATSLRELNFSATRCGDDALEVVSSNLGSLEHLSMRLSFVGRTELESVGRRLSRLRSLRQLDASCNGALEELGLEGISACPLEVLNLRSTAIQSLKPLFAVGPLAATLADLNLQQTMIRTADLSELLEHCPGLRRLNVAYCDLSDDALMAISEHGRQLIALKVSFASSITGGGLALALPALSDTLESLDIGGGAQGTGISDSLTPVLAQLINLREFTVWESKITGFGIAWLKPRLPFLVAADTRMNSSDGTYIFKIPEEDVPF